MEFKRSLVLVIIFISFSLNALENLHIKIGTYENSPKIFTDTEGNVSGFWAEITNYIAKEENWEIEWIHGNWEQCLERLEFGEIDMMVIDFCFRRNSLYVTSKFIRQSLKSWLKYQF